MSGAQSEEINPIVAGVVSLLIAGVGHIVINGQTKRGAIWLAAGFGSVVLITILSVVTLGLGSILFLFTPLIWIGSGIDAYLQAEKINAGEVVVH